ncbi:MAG TPA: hypothetical protein VL947_02340 [Cytophagales bacterium]|nr:hypothetical protein [Cytophagales bacterium]
MIVRKNGKAVACWIHAKHAQTQTNGTGIGAGMALEILVAFAV